MPQAPKTISNKQTEEERAKMLADLDKADPNAADPDEEKDDEVVDDEVVEDDETEPDKKPKGDEGESEDEDENTDEDEDDVIDEDDETEPDKKPKTPEKKPVEKKDDVDYKKKFSESSAEAQVLQLRLKKEQDARDAAAALPEPTDEEMRTLIGEEEWDTLSPAMQKIAKRSEHAERKNKVLVSVGEEVKKDQEFITKVNAYAADPETLKQFPSLLDREEEFVKFASKPTRRNLDLEDIAGIFIATHPVAPKTKHKGNLFTRSNASISKNPQKPIKGLNADQVKAIRTADPKKYQQMIKEGKIKPADLLN